THNRLQQTGATKLSRRQIDGNPEILGPLRRCGTSLTDCPFPERDNQPNLLCQGYERTRCDHAPCGMMPTNEGLKAADLVAREIHDRLIVKLELSGEQCFAQIIFQGAPLLHLRVHLRLEEAKRAAPIALGPVEGKVRIAYDLLGADPISRTNGDADASTDDDLMSVNVIRLAYRTDYPVC